MSKILLDIYGYKVFIEDLNGGQVVSKIKSDFLFFLQNIENCDAYSIVTPPTGSLSIVVNNFDFKFSGITIGKTKLCNIKQVSFKKRVFSYYLTEKISAKAVLIDSLKFKKFTICCSNPDLSFEIVYLLILSAVGENLESRGLMRLHASSFLFQNKSFCFWGRRRAGKSTLILNLMKNLDLSVYSDENTLYDLSTNRILPFPIRMSIDTDAARSLDHLVNIRQNKRYFLDDKLLVDIPANKQAAANSLDFFYVLGCRETENKLVNFSFKDYVFLFVDIVFGVGMIQMAEFLIRPTNFQTLLKILINRFRLYYKILGFRPRVWERSSSLQKNINYCVESILKFVDTRRDIS